MLFKNIFQQSQFTPLHFTRRKKNILKSSKFILSSLTIITLCLLNILFCSIDNSSALTYSSNAEVGFTFNPTISVNLSGDLLINNLSPGSVSDSNTINVNVSTNASQGYVLTATSGTKTTNTDLVNQTNSAYKFSSIATNASLSNLTTDNTWGYSYSEDSGTNWSNYSGLPLDNDDEGATGKQLINTINPADNRTLQFKIAARASSDQAAGTYQNTINFYAVANPDPTLQPVSCPAGKICYNANSLTPVEGSMGQQSVSSNSIMLLASNFSRSGYGFAGWADSTTYNGLRYGPHQTITVPDDINTNGLSLYAIWVKSAGDMQNWQNCEQLSIGEVTALKDVRDNNVYAVAKLVDGKCWMIENLRLDNTNSDNSTGVLAQGYGTSATYGNFSGLANPESENFQNSTTANSIYYSGTQVGTANININTIDYPGSRFPRYNNRNTSSRDSNPNVNSKKMYSYGNYYTWPAAIADTAHYTTHNQDITGTSICPKGWKLPRGGDKTKLELGSSDAWDLIVIYLYNDVLPANYNSSTTPYYAVPEESEPISKILRSYPNNFVYSGNMDQNYARSVGSHGAYWTSTKKMNGSSYSYGEAYHMFLDGFYVQPGTISTPGTTALSIRCIAQDR